ncbi:MAG: hypothetical protein K1X29_08020 [Bdellovibrionales bacterium]|nr:hypothetical protein [Bdellovibrionales bacterium]
MLKRIKKIHFKQSFFTLIFSIFLTILPLHGNTEDINNLNLPEQLINLIKSLGGDPIQYQSIADYTARDIGLDHALLALEYFLGNHPNLEYFHFSTINERLYGLLKNETLRDRTLTLSRILTLTLPPTSPNYKVVVETLLMNSLFFGNLNNSNLSARIEALNHAKPLYRQFADSFDHGTYIDINYRTLKKWVIADLRFRELSQSETQLAQAEVILTQRALEVIHLILKDIPPNELVVFYTNDKFPPGSLLHLGILYRIIGFSPTGQPLDPYLHPLGAGFSLDLDMPTFIILINKIKTLKLIPNELLETMVERLHSFALEQGNHLSPDDLIKIGHTIDILESSILNLNLLQQIKDLPRSIQRVISRTAPTLRLTLDCKTTTKITIQTITACLNEDPKNFELFIQVLRLPFGILNPSHLRIDEKERLRSASRHHLLHLLSNPPIELYSDPDILKMALTFTQNLEFLDHEIISLLTRWSAGEIVPFAKTLLWKFNLIRRFGLFSAHIFNRELSLQALHILAFIGKGPQGRITNLQTYRVLLKLIRGRSPQLRNAALMVLIQLENNGNQVTVAESLASLTKHPLDPLALIKFRATMVEQPCTALLPIEPAPSHSLKPNR